MLSSELYLSSFLVILIIFNCPVMKIYFKTKLCSRIAFVAAALLFISCNKDINSTNTNELPDQYADLTTHVSSSVSGFVTDQNDAIVTGASVKVGTISTLTDQYGYFEIKNVQVVKEAATVTVIYPGYFKGIKTYMAIQGKSSFFRIKLLPKTTVGTIDAAAGGNVSLSNGLNISFNANGIKNAATGSIYSGAVNVAAQYIDPASEELDKIMPGDLRGINTNGNIKGLASYGMMVIELTANSGELLQIADGKKATLSIPVPASILSNAPAIIPLWYFDESNGLWKEEGAATKTGNTYVGDVSHFSYWNCDIPTSNVVPFDCTITDASNRPLSGVEVKVTNTGGIPGSAHGYTNTDGFVSGYVPANAQLILEVNLSGNCGNPSFSKNFTTTNTRSSMGNIIIDNFIIPTIVTGTITDCNNVPVSNGYIIMSKNNVLFKYPIDQTGSYQFITYLCNGNNEQVNFFAGDLATLNRSDAFSYTLMQGINNAVPNIQACGINTDEHIRYTLNGGPLINFSSPVDIFGQSWGSGLTDSVGHFYSLTPTYNANIEVQVRGSNLGIGNMLSLVTIQCSQINGTSFPVNPTFINLTEYGPVGGYMSGNFATTIYLSTTPITYNDIVLDFRIRRLQ